MTLKTTDVSLLSHKSFLITLFTLIALGGCTPKGTVTSSANKYSEDLSIYRPSIPTIQEDTSGIDESAGTIAPYVAPMEHLKSEIDSVVSLTMAYNKKKNAVDGYTIQVYTGISRDDANKAQVRIYGVLGEASPWIDYQQPVYKVKVGKFYSKLEANEMFQQLKSKFPNALMIPQKFRLK